MNLSRPLAYTTSEWIEKAQLIHSSKYDYSKVEYLGSTRDIIFTCQIHGDISQKAKKHLEGQGCKQCSILVQRKTKKQFVAESQEWHGDFYDYSRIELTNIHKKVIIICPIHGYFSQKPSKHQRGQGCKKCKGREVWNQDDFLKKAKKLHGALFDYSKVTYKKTNIKVEIICRACNNHFLQTPNSHFHGSGCPKCAGHVPMTDDIFRDLLREEHDNQIVALEEYKGSSHKLRFRHNICGHEWKNQPGHVLNRHQGCRKCKDFKKRLSQSSFELRLTEQHEGRIIALESFVTTTTPIKVKHLDCGRIWQTEPRTILRSGCIKCMNISRTKTNEEFLAELNEKHFGEIIALEPYKNVRTNIKVKHSICGHIWRPNPSDLIAKGHGCAKCASSKGNRDIDHYLSERRLNFIREQRFESCRFKNPLPFDFYLPEFKVLIEFDGVQHFSVVDYWGGEKGLEDRKMRDQIKNNWAKKNKMRLFRIRYYENINQKMKVIEKVLQGI